ncbi:hypothetical protein Prudu_022841 [Prunus dulcis]|uniref:non-specific serine/threonine protein kinase n=1 Tax=Prunus dulcis TaxID=3755 RepID=A0A4Y1S090_PRUDU|nr:hypothetical protein Prudu_022841 [Prunus dulcis]
MLRPIPTCGIFQKAPANAFIGNSGMIRDLQGVTECNPSVRNSKTMVANSIVLSLMFRKKSKKPDELKISQNFEKLESMILQEEVKFTFGEVVKAIEDFHEKYCIGKGGFGRVYKAELQSGQRGSLGKALYGVEGVTELGWATRLKVVKGLAHSLSYLHNDCSPPIVHRDVLSTMYLLESDFKHWLSDFGTARLLSTNSSNWTHIAGSFGYMAPELAFTMRLWSGGTGSYDGKAPRGYVRIQANRIIKATKLTESSKPMKDNAELPLEDVLDQRLEASTNELAKAVVLVMSLALLCICTHPILDLRWFMWHKNYQLIPYLAFLIH